MKTLSFLALFAALLALPAQAAPEKYRIDREHTRIVFFINHLGFSDMVGEFTDYDGALAFDETKPEASTLSFTIKPASVRTSSKALDEHLQKPEFFNSAAFPTIQFASTGVKATGPNTGQVEGKLTMLGKTLPVVLKVRLNKADYFPMTGDFVSGFSAETTLKRSEFGMGAYVPMVGDDVRVMIETEWVNLERPKKPATAPKSDSKQ